MENLSNYEKEKLERTLLKVKFKKEVDDLLFHFEEGGLLEDIKKELETSNSFLVNFLLDPTEDMKAMYAAIGVKNIASLNKELAKDRIFSRIIRILDQEDLEWEVRQNSLRQKTLKGQILQLQIRKKV